MLRKYVFNPHLAPHGAKEFIRLPLISLEYAAAFDGYVFRGWEDGLQYCHSTGRINSDEQAYLLALGKLKQDGRAEMTRGQCLESVRIIANLHRSMATEFLAQR